MALIWEGGVQTREAGFWKQYHYPRRETETGRDTQGGQYKGREANTYHWLKTGKIVKTLTILNVAEKLWKSWAEKELDHWFSVHAEHRQHWRVSKRYEPRLWLNDHWIKLYGHRWLQREQFYSPTLKLGNGYTRRHLKCVLQSLDSMDKFALLMIIS